MAKKPNTLFQDKAIALLDEKGEISCSLLQRHLQCSFLKSCELMIWLSDKKYIDKWNPPPAAKNIKKKRRAKNG